MKCSNCGKENAPSARICEWCGSVMPVETTQQSQTASAQYYTQPEANGMQNIPPEYKPISMWGYFGYELLFSIPCVGFILLLVFAFGGTQNHNLKNFARSYFCYMIVVVVLATILIATGVLASLSL